MSPVPRQGCRARGPHQRGPHRSDQPQRTGRGRRGSRQEGQGVPSQLRPAKIVLARLDYRLLHGQVVFTWTTKVQAERIIVVDNAAANDDINEGRS